MGIGLVSQIYIYIYLLYIFRPGLSQPALVVVRQFLSKLWLLLLCVMSPAVIMLLMGLLGLVWLMLLMEPCKLLMALNYELCLADAISNNPSHASTCSIWK